MERILTSTVWERVPALLCLLTLATIADAQKITTFDVPNAVAYPAAINPAGEVVGSYFLANDDHSHGFLRQRNGTIITFDVPNVLEQTPGCPLVNGWSVIFTIPTDINPAGQVVGRYMQGNPAFLPNCTRLRGFLRDQHGTFTTFGGEWWPTGISEADANSIGTAAGNVMIDPGGLIAGWYGTDNIGLPFVGFVRQRDGTVITFGLPVGYPFTYPTAMNTEGELTGYWMFGINSVGFFRALDGTITTFSVPGSSQTRPTGISPNRDIVGVWDSGGFLRARDGTITTFNVLGATGISPIAINAAGQITGSYSDSVGNSHGFQRQRDGTITTFDVPNAVSTSPTAISSTGQITGVYLDGTGYHAFTRK